MKAIVTGATGFLGFELVKLLIDKDFQVLALGRNTDKLKKLEAFGATTQAVTLENFSGITSHFDGADVLFHCAALSSGWGKEADFVRVNVEGTSNVVRWSIAHGVERIVYISSTSVYFNFSDRFNIKETDSIAQSFANGYARSKYQAEKIIEAIPSREMQWSILRPRGIIGKGDPSILPRVLKVMHQGWFPLLRQGRAQVDLTHVKNVASAAHLAGATKRAHGEIFNISNDEPISVHYLLESLTNKIEHRVQFIKINYVLLSAVVKWLEFFAKKFNLAEPVMTSYGIGLLSYSQTFDISKAKKILGYNPQYSIKEAIESCFDNA